MTLDEFQSLWEEDAKIDNDDLHLESTKIPVLHAKYYRIYNNVLTLKKAQENKFKILRKEKWEYYSGKSAPEVYEKNPFNYKVLKADLDKYLDADEELIRCVTKVEYHTMMLNYLDSILKTILNRTYQIKNSIEWQRFIRGYD